MILDARDRAFGVLPDQRSGRCMSPVSQTFTVQAGDGRTIQAADDGTGRPVLVVHPGLDDGRSWRRVAQALAPRFRVLRLHRRRYRLDIPDKPWSMQDEAADVVALATALGEPVLLVGHSSGAVVALEALAASPSSFAGAVLYEPPAHLQPDEWTEPLRKARGALKLGKPGRAMDVFLRDIVQTPPWAARLTGLALPLMSFYRALVPRQISDAEALQHLGVRLDVYAKIPVPTVLLAGTKSPPHLRTRVDALAAAIPGAEVVVLDGVGHDAATRKPADVAKAINELATRVWRSGPRC